MTWSPWRALARSPNITLRWERMPGLLGIWQQSTSTIKMHPEQSQAQRRSTLTHELVHQERGDTGQCSGRVRRIVNEEAARRLITTEALADALLWTQDEWEVAQEVWTDVETARVRIETLTDAETAYIDSRIAAREGSA